MNEKEGNRCAPPLVIDAKPGASLNGCPVLTKVGSPSSIDRTHAIQDGMVSRLGPAFSPSAKAKLAAKAVLMKQAPRANAPFRNP